MKNKSSSPKPMVLLDVDRLLQFDCCTFNLPGQIDSKHSSPVGNCGRKLMLGLFKRRIPCFFVMSYSWPGSKFDTSHLSTIHQFSPVFSLWVGWLFYPCQWGPVVFVPSSRDRISQDQLCLRREFQKTSLGVNGYHDVSDVSCQYQDSKVEKSIDQNII